ncbi:MAG TPA: glycosyltransferase [Gaiellaceae bacterium]|nr:glycosyltransferase [Gaiellaceae bacterium]
MSGPPTVLIAARDEEERIAQTIGALRRELPEAFVIVADDGSRDRTAELAEAAGAQVVRLPRRGKGQALTIAEKEAPAGTLLLCDADVRGALSPLLSARADVAVAAFPQRRGGGFGIAKRAARAMIRARTGFEAREPLSGQRALSAQARERCFPLAAGFGCEVGMTVDALEAGLAVHEVELQLGHRATGRDVAGFAHRSRQLTDALLALGPQGVNHRGLRLPYVGWVLGAAGGPATAAIAAAGLADDLWSGPERGVRAHLRARRTTGVLKLVAIPAIGLLATRKLSGALLVGLGANLWNQLDTRPGRALKAYLLVAPPLRAPLLPAAVLLPCDLREMTMLGDAGSNVLGGLLGLRSVGRLTARGRWIAIGALASLNFLGETRSLGELIERTPVLRDLDGLGRQA